MFEWKKLFNSYCLLLCKVSWSNSYQLTWHILNVTPHLHVQFFTEHDGFFFLIVWDVKMSDLLSEKVSLAHFRGVAFVGGFSYADVMDSAKGYAPVIASIQTLHTYKRQAHMPHTTLSNNAYSAAISADIVFIPLFYSIAGQEWFALMLVSKANSIDSMLATIPFRSAFATDVSSWHCSDG